jgi:hypothetical protein
MAIELQDGRKPLFIPRPIDSLRKLRLQAARRKSEILLWKNENRPGLAARTLQKSFLPVNRFGMA